MGTETAPYFCRVSISGTAGSLQLGETLVGRKGSDFWKLANVGGAKVLNPNWLAQVSGWNSMDKGWKSLIYTEHNKKYKLKTGLHHGYLHLRRGEPGTFYNVSDDRVYMM